MERLSGFIFSLLLQVSSQCSPSSQVMDKIDLHTQPLINPFRDHLIKTISRKDFSPPTQVYFGFKPVKDVSEILPDKPEFNIEDLNILPGPPYFEDISNRLQEFEDVFPENTQIYQESARDQYVPYKKEEEFQNLEINLEDNGPGFDEKFKFPDFNSFTI